ncbi:MAG: insulinase family protein [Candidatus Omnitrophica bacterium]|nr:insulinase family protein [Candidatus Omnitrophota bacterium]
MRKSFSGILFVSLIFFICGYSFAAEVQSSKQILDNGLTVLISEIPTSPVVSVFGLVKTGAATEGRFLGSGISHLVEHMLFKGTQNRKAGEIASAIQAVGGTINASTDKDYTIYTITVPYQKFDVALDILADMLQNASFNVEEFKKEKEVILSEIRMHGDDPDRKLNDLVFENDYVRHPYRIPTIGYEQLFSSLKQGNATKYYRMMYVPNNMVISIAGHVDSQEVSSKVANQFKGFLRKFDVVRNLPQEPQQIAPRYYEEQYPTPLARFSMTFQGVNILHEDLYALDVLASILGEGESSRLFLNVYKKKQLVYSISAYDYTPMDQGYFGVDAVLEEKNIPAAIDAIWEEIKEIQAKGVLAPDMEKAKKQVLAKYIMGRQTADQVAYTQAIDEAFSGDYRFSEKYAKAVQDIKAEDIKRVAQRYLKDSRLTTVVLKPKKEAPVAVLGEKKAASEPAIQKVQFSNGVTVLIRENHAFPVVSMDVVMQAGTLQEPEALNGISNLTALMLTQGTTSKNAQKIAGIIDSLGMSLSGFSGRNSFGVTMECLSADFKPALDLLEDVVKNPSFPDDELLKNKETVKADIKLKEDSISQMTGQALRQTLFVKHPLRFDIEGTIPSIDKMTRKDIVGFYDQFAVGANMVVSVFGDINAQDVLKDLQKRFGNISSKKVELKSFTEEPPTKEREKALTMKKEQAMFMLGFQGPGFHDQDKYALEVLTGILGSSFDGRMFRNIRDQLGKAYSLGGSYTPGPDMGFIYFYVLTTEKDISKVKELMAAEIKNLQDKDVSAEELNEIKTYLKGTFVAGLETNASLGLKVSLDELYGLGFGDYQNYAKAIDRVTAQDIRRLALRYLDLNKSALVITTPSAH